MFRNNDLVLLDDRNTEIRFNYTKFIKIIAIIFVYIFIICISFCFGNMVLGSVLQESDIQSVLYIPPNEQSQTEYIGEAQESDESISIQYEDKITINTDDNTASLSFVNLDGSQYGVSVKLYIGDNLIASSGLISPGYQINELQTNIITQNIPRGDYTGTMLISCYDKEKNTLYNNTSYEVTISISSYSQTQAQSA